MFGMLTIHGKLRAKSPLHHGGNEKTGARVRLNRIKYVMRDEDGEHIEDIPIISGNTIRGYLRRLVFSDFLRQVDYEIDLSKKGGQLLYHSLFTGGILRTVGESSGAIDLELKRKVIKLIPPARLFGFSIGNQMIESTLCVDFARPICIEFKEDLPDYIHPTFSYYELLDTVPHTRKDDLKEQREEDEQAVQMIVEYEVFIPGTVFYHRFKLEDPDELDMSCMARVIELWKMKPYVGGKKSTNFGELDIEYDFEATSDLYLNFLKENAEDIRNLLDELMNI